MGAALICSGGVCPSSMLRLETHVFERDQFKGWRGENGPLNMLNIYANQGGMRGEEIKRRLNLWEAL